MNRKLKIFVVPLQKGFLHFMVEIPEDYFLIIADQFFVAYLTLSPSLCPFGHLFFTLLTSLASPLIFDGMSVKNKQHRHEQNNKVFMESDIKFLTNLTVLEILDKTKVEASMVSSETFFPLLSCLTVAHIYTAQCKVWGFLSQQQTQSFYLLFFFAFVLKSSLSRSSFPVPRTCVYPSTPHPTSNVTLLCPILQTHTCVHCVFGDDLFVCDFSCVLLNLPSQLQGMFA